MEVGAHCHYDLCQQQTFLPFDCDSCHNKFCKKHRTQESHECIPSARDLLITKQKQEKKIAGRKKIKKTHRCSVKKCKKREWVSISCKDCGLSFCLPHRYPDAHQCAGKIPASYNEKKRANQLRMKRQSFPASKQFMPQSCAKAESQSLNRNHNNHNKKQGQIMTVPPPPVRPDMCDIPVSYPTSEMQRVYARKRVLVSFDEIQRPRPAPAGWAPSPSPPARNSRNYGKGRDTSHNYSYNASQHQSALSGGVLRILSQQQQSLSIRGSRGRIQRSRHTVQVSMRLQHVQNASSPPAASRAKKSKLTKNGPPSFEDHMSFKEAQQLRLHDKIDHRDQVGRFVFATIVEKQNTNLKIHYDGWARKWDTWSDYALEINKFGKAGSISKRSAHRFKELKKGDYVDLNPILRHPGWKCGEIRRLDQKSGQVQVVYECNDKNYLYWAHLDNRNEITEFTSRSGTDQQLQKMVESKISKKKSPQEYHDVHNNYGMKNNNNNNQYQRTMTTTYTSPMDEMQQFRKIRAKRFPRLPNEVLNNPFNAGDWLEVRDTQTGQWVAATVIDKENNWIVVHFDGRQSKYDQKMHCVKHEKLLRALGSGLQITQSRNYGMNNNQNQQQPTHTSPMDEITDEMEQLHKMLNELVNNPFSAGDWLEVQDLMRDTQTRQGK